MDHAQAVLSTFNPDASETFGADIPVDSVRSAIADALRSRGHSVDEHVGGASFRCDIAIVNPSGDGYSLGILLDRDSDDRLSVEERFLFRPSILRAFGWRVIDVPVASWQRAREATIDRIEAELKSDSWSVVESDPYVGVVLPNNAGASPTVAVTPRYSALSPTTPKPEKPVETLPPAKAGEAPQEKLTEFRFVQGTSNKYWKVGVVGTDLIVEFGRVGTKGRRVVKTYDDEDRAKREAVKLTLEKTRKGYEEIG